MREKTTTDLPQVLSLGRLFIGGEWVDAASGKTFEVVNPAKAETLTGPSARSRPVETCRAPKRVFA